MSQRSGPVPLTRSVVVVVLLSLVTFGLYTGIWYLQRREALNDLNSSTKLGVFGPIALIGLTVLGLVLTPHTTPHEVAMLTIATLNVVMAFRVKRMIVDHLGGQVSDVLPRSTGILDQYSPSSLLTFLLNIFYLQFKLNELVAVGELWSSAETVEAAAT